MVCFRFTVDEEAQDAITKAMNEVNMKVLDREIEGGEEVDPVYRADFEKWKVSCQCVCVYARVCVCREEEILYQTL